MTHTLLGACNFRAWNTLPETSISPAAANVVLPLWPREPQSSDRATRLIIETELAILDWIPFKSKRQPLTGWVQKWAKVKSFHNPTNQHVQSHIVIKHNSPIIIRRISLHMQTRCQRCHLMPIDGIRAEKMPRFLVNLPWSPIGPEREELRVAAPRAEFVDFT